MSVVAADPVALVVDDDLGTRETFTFALNGAGIPTVAEASLSGARAVLGVGGFRVLVLDRWLGSDDGYELLRSATESPIPRTVIVTAFADVSSTVEAMKLGAVDVLEKPLAIETLLLLVNGLLGTEQSPRLAPSTAVVRDLVRRAERDLFEFVNLVQALQSSATPAVRLALVLDRRVSMVLAGLEHGDLHRRSERAWGRELGIDPAHLGRLLREGTGLGFREWRRFSRVRRALALVASGADRWKEIAHIVGIPQSQLTREFKMTVGLTPREVQRLAYSGDTQERAKDRNSC